LVGVAPVFVIPWPLAPGFDLRKPSRRSRMTNNKLYVSNVPFDASEHSLRKHFEPCGGVLDVEIMLEPRSGRSRGLACVTMTSPAFATAALAKLDGVAFEGRVLHVSDVPVGKEKPPPPAVKIVQQFRERGNMAYDLDCLGIPLTLRMFPTADDQWRVEARATDAVNEIVVAGTAKTRRDALAEAVRAWNDGASMRGVRPLDGDALSKAMYAVKAV
jgi:RNA recognition motif-containing protein